MIARRAGLSPRYLNGLFGDEGASLMRHVWRRRLEQCAKDLCDPRRAGERVAEIAFRWGFNDASHFSRAFRQQFGSAPGEFQEGTGGVGGLARVGKARMRRIAGSDRRNRPRCPSSELSK